MSQTLVLDAQATSQQLMDAAVAASNMPRAQALPQLLACWQILRQRDDVALDRTAVRALVRVSRTLFILESDSPAIQEALTRAEAWAQAHGDSVVLGMVYAGRGAMLQGDLQLPESLNLLTRALACSRASGDAWVASSHWLRLGTRLGDAGMAEQAHRCFEHSLALVAHGEHQEDVTRALYALVNLGWTLGLLGRYDEALRHLDHWFTLARDPRFEEPLGMMCLAHENRAHALLGLRRTAEAIQAAEQAVTWATRFGTATQRWSAELVWGLARVHAGDVEFGLERVRHAVEACRLQSPKLLHGALTTAAQAYQRADQHDMARMYFHELLHLKQRVQAQVIERLEADVAGFDADPGRVPAPVVPGMALPEASGAVDRRRMSQLNRLVEEHAIAAERLDDTTGKHCYRVGRLAALLGRAVGLDDDVCFMLDLAARLHDVGKLAVPESILMKPGMLTDAEREVMQHHTKAGWEILSRSNIPQMHIAQEIARHHHEWWNGNGYPDKLRGAQIPIAARVSALADVFDALSHARPYKGAWTIDATLAEIARLRGLQFDPQLTDVFMTLVAQLRSAHGDQLDAVLSEAAADSPFVQDRERWAHAVDVPAGMAGVGAAATPA